MSVIGRPGDQSYVSQIDAFTRGRKKEKAEFVINASANPRSTRDVKYASRASQMRRVDKGPSMQADKIFQKMTATLQCLLADKEELSKTISLLCQRRPILTNLLPQKVHKIYYNLGLPTVHQVFRRNRSISNPILTRKHVKLFHYRQVNLPIYQRSRKLARPGASR